MTPLRIYVDVEFSKLHILITYIDEFLQYEIKQ